MAAPMAQTITACFSSQGGVMKVNIQPQDVISPLCENISKRLSKKGVGVQWGPETPTTILVLRVVVMDQGNQLLRYLLPFISPAVLEVEGHIRVGNGAPKPIHVVKKAHFGLFGGSPVGMLKTCGSQIAAKVAKETLASLGK